MITISTNVISHKDATGVVKERMDQMETLKGAMKTLKPIFRGKSDYDINVVKANALIIRDNAAAHMTKLFPEGSLKSPSEAKPEIWQDWEVFEKLAVDLEQKAQALHNSVHEQPNSNRDNKTTLPPKTIFKMIAQNCADCHKSFRVKE
jgi:cytochrome c556